jgi:hypothetical protein
MIGAIALLLAYSAIVPAFPRLIAWPSTATSSPASPPTTR